MASWLEEYSRHLQLRDRREQAQKEQIDAYTKLADRTAALEAPQVDHEQAPSSSTASKSSPATRSSGKDPEKLASEGSLEAIRADLATAQRSRSDLTVRADKLTSQLEASRAMIADYRAKVEILTRERDAVKRKYRDRESEIKEKGLLLREGQDDFVALDLELNMAQQRVKELEKDNQELVDRWMAKIGEEAEAMNTRSRFS